MRRLAPFFSSAVWQASGVLSRRPWRRAPGRRSHTRPNHRAASHGRSRATRGDPDFDGIWNYATMTPLERPRDMTTDALSAADAAAYEKRTTDRRGRGQQHRGT